MIASDLASLTLEVFEGDDHQPDAPLRNKLSPTLVVQRALFATSDTQDGEPVRLVEERHSLGVLALVELDHEVPRRPVTVDRQRHRTPGLGRRVPE